MNTEKINTKNLETDKQDITKGIIEVIKLQNDTIGAMISHFEALENGNEDPIMGEHLETYKKLTKKVEEYIRSLEKTNDLIILLEREQLK